MVGGESLSANGLNYLTEAYVLIILSQDIVHCSGIEQTVYSVCQFGGLGNSDGSLRTSSLYCM